MFRYDAATGAVARRNPRRGVRIRRRRQSSPPGPTALAAAPRLTSRDAFRALAKQVGAATGAKGKALFHTIRLAVTGEADGPELDLLVPAIDRAADFTPADGLAPVVGCRERAAAFAARWHCDDSVTAGSGQRDSVTAP